MPTGQADSADGCGGAATQGPRGAPHAIVCHMAAPNLSVPPRKILGGSSQYHAGSVGDAGGVSGANQTAPIRKDPHRDDLLSHRLHGVRRMCGLQGWQVWDLPGWLHPPKCKLRCLPERPGLGERKWGLLRCHRRRWLQWSARERHQQQPSLLQLWRWAQKPHSVPVWGETLCCWFPDRAETDPPHGQKVLGWCRLQPGCFELDHWWQYRCDFLRRFQAAPCKGLLRAVRGHSTPRPWAFGDGEGDGGCRLHDLLLQHPGLLQERVLLPGQHGTWDLEGLQHDLCSRGALAFTGQQHRFAADLGWHCWGSDGGGRWELHGDRRGGVCRLRLAVCGLPESEQRKQGGAEELHHGRVATTALACAGLWVILRRSRCWRRVATPEAQGPCWIRRRRWRPEANVFRCLLLGGWARRMEWQPVHT